MRGNSDMCFWLSLPFRLIKLAVKPHIHFTKTAATVLVQKMCADEPTHIFPGLPMTIADRSELQSAQSLLGFAQRIFKLALRLIHWQPYIRKKKHCTPTSRTRAHTKHEGFQPLPSNFRLSLSMGFGSKFSAAASLKPPFLRSAHLKFWIFTT